MLCCGYLGKGPGVAVCALIWIILNLVYAIIGQIRLADDITLFKDYISKAIAGLPILN